VKALRKIFAFLVRLFAGTVRPVELERVNYRNCVHVRAPWGQQMNLSPAPLPKALRKQLRRADAATARLKSIIEEARQ
jgi:hypothetical protein